MIELAFTLPWPPSSNRYWRVLTNGRLAGKVYVSKEAQTYRDVVGDRLWEQGVPCKKLDGSIGLDLLLRPPRLGSDISNRIKVLEDCLQIHGVILNDKLIDDLHVHRGPKCPDGRVDVIVRQLAAVAEQQNLLGAAS